MRIDSRVLSEAARRAAVVGVIPARHSSTRFPGKPLVPLCGKPMLQWVHEAASRAASLGAVIVATDDDRIARCARSFGAEVAMTRDDHPSGTDRLAEVAEGLSAEIVVNVQGDEPLLSPASVDAAVDALRQTPAADMATLATPLEDAAAWRDPSVVKVVTSKSGAALYFSRAPVPWPRDAAGAIESGPPGGALRHVGLYAYRRRFLLELARLPPCPLEQTESLEQLRALWHGARIQVALTHSRSLAVDTPGDVAAVEEALRAATTTLPPANPPSPSRAAAARP